MSSPSFDMFGQLTTMVAIADFFKTRFLFYARSKNTIDGLLEAVGKATGDTIEALGKAGVDIISKTIASHIEDFLRNLGYFLVEQFRTFIGL